MPNENCSCDKLDSCFTVTEKSVFLGAESESLITIPQCPRCLGALNGRIDCHLFKFPMSIGEYVKSERDYLLDDASFSTQYEIGYDEGMYEGTQSETDSLLFSNSKGQFLIGQEEFGETYHTALAMLCHPGVNANLKEASVCQTVFFTSIFEKSRCVYQNTETKIANTESTSMFLNLFDPSSGLVDPHAVVLQAFTRNCINPPYDDSDAQNHSEQEDLIGKLEIVLRQLSIDAESNKAIVWIRSKNDDSSFRNLNDAFLLEIIEEITSRDITNIILVGNRPSEDQGNLLTRKFPDVTFYDMTDFQKRKCFKLIFGDHQIAGQLLFFKTLQDKFNVKFAIGMMSGGMDGPAFIGIPTIILTFDGEESRIPMASKMIRSMVCVHYDRESQQLIGDTSIKEAIKFVMGVDSIPEQCMDSGASFVRPR